MPYPHNASLNPAPKDDAYVHAAADSYYGDPDYSWDYYINSWQPLTEKNRGIRKDLLHLAVTKIVQYLKEGPSPGEPLESGGSS
jgi:hypothetical protein